MVAGGLTFAVPGVMPAHADMVASNPHLFVSAEGQNSKNEISGANIIEVAIVDPQISDTDEGEGEPQVSVNGRDLRMLQGSDGVWYAYFADRSVAQTLDNHSITADGVTAAVYTNGTGMDYGFFCSPSTATDVAGIGLSDTTAVAFPLNVTGATQGGEDAGTCDGTLPANNLDFASNQDGETHTLIRENKTLNLNTGNGVELGQLGLANENLWPFIQLYDFNEDGNIEIIYNRAGGDESVELLFDDPKETLTLDRTHYPQGAQVLVTIDDLALNIDPTDEDTWVINTEDKQSHYLLFDEDGARVNIDQFTNNTDFDDSGATTNPIDEDLKITKNAQGGTTLLLCQTTNDYGTGLTNGNLTGDNDGACDDANTDGDGTSAQAFDETGDLLVGFVETGSNTSTFVNWAENNEANLVVRTDAERGTSFEVEYKDPGFISGVIAHAFGSFTFDTASIGDEWNSGERMDIVLVDADANTNALDDQDLDLDDPSVLLVPSIRVGDPFTLGIAGVESDTEDNMDVTFFNHTLSFDDIEFDSWSAFTSTENSASGVHTNNTVTDFVVEKFSDRLRLETFTNTTLSGDGAFLIEFEDITAKDLYDRINEPTGDGVGEFLGTNLINVDVRALADAGMTVDTIMIANWTCAAPLGDSCTDGITALALASEDGQDLISLNGSQDQVDALFDMAATDSIGILVNFTATSGATIDQEIPFVIDFFSFGLVDLGITDQNRVNNAIYRAELEEDGTNSDNFEGSLEYLMLNQLNVLDEDTYDDFADAGRVIDDELLIIVSEDFTDEDSIRINYLDLGADGVSTQIAEQQEAPSHSGVVSFDSSSYKVADTVTVTLEDSDLNVDNDVIDIFTVVDPDTGLETSSTVGSNDGNVGEILYDDGTAFGRLLDITFDDELWTSQDANGCAAESVTDDGLFATGFTLVETAKDSGIFVGDFQIPNTYCQSSSDTNVSVTGTDIEVNYVDFRDASGEIIEVGDSAGVRANTGSVSLDRTVYPVPFGTPDDFAESTSESPSDGTTERSLFPVHEGAADGEDGLEAGEFLDTGDLTVHIRINDPDFDVSASGEDTIAQDVRDIDGDGDNDSGPLKISVIRGANEVVLAYAGGATSNSTGLIDVGDDVSGTDAADAIQRIGAITEIAPDAGIFELDLDIRYTDGPASTTCPDTADGTDDRGYLGFDGSTRGEDTIRFDEAADSGTYCILQGDILQVEYLDPTDASGDENTVTDSATFDLRNGVLQSDKSVYIIGSDMILTLIEPDFDLDNDAAETYDLDLVEWDSDAADTTLGSDLAFDPEPSDFRETGDSTGIFQVVIEIPNALGGDNLERGEEIELEYTDWGPSGSDFVGDEDEDVNITVYTSNFGATVELDQKVYSWTDKVFMTIVAPDHNFDSDLVDEIGETSLDPIRISTRGHDLDNYKLVETGTDTGIFTGEVILTGFEHDADGDGETGDASGFDTNPRTEGEGPTSGFIQSDDDDGLTVSFEFSEDETVVGSALIRWNIGEVQWLEASYPASGTGVVRVIDPDMNLDPEAVDNFDVDVWSDSDAGGIDLTITETNEATGIFEGTVFFTTLDESSGHRLRVAEGDTVTAEYEDNTLPDPYTTADELDITATSLIGTVVPPLERAPAANLRTVDAFGNSLDSVSVDQQVQISADLANGQDREQAFAYLVQIQDGNGVTVSLAWITGSLSAGQSFSPALSWIPTEAGTYSATAFVWESVDNPTALSPPVSTTITVN